MSRAERRRDHEGAKMGSPLFLVMLKASGSLVEILAVHTSTKLNLSFLFQLSKDSPLFLLRQTAPGVLEFTAFVGLTE